MRSTAITCGLLMLFGGAPSAQSLADAARAAQAASERNRKNPAPYYTDMPWTLQWVPDDAEILDFELTMPIVRRLAAASLAWLRAAQADRALELRVARQLRDAKSLADLERAYASEPGALRPLQAAGMSAHEYAVVYAAAQLASQTTQNNLVPWLRGRGRIAANAALLVQNREEIRDLYREHETIEAQLAERAAAEHAAALPKP